MCADVPENNIFIEEISALVYVCQNYFLLKKHLHTGIYAKMAAARFSSDVLQMFYGPITEAENINLPQPLQPDVVEIDDVFILARNNFQEWLRVWKMVVSEGNVNNKDLLAFARETKAKFTDLVENEIKELFKKRKSKFWVESKVFNRKKR